MHNIHIGSWVLNGQLILYLSFGAAGWLMLRYRLRNMTECRTMLSVVTNAFWLWIIIWKASFLIFNPVEVIQRPAALLYFDGGERGGWIASLVAAVYIWIRTVKLNIPLPSWTGILTVFLLSGWSAYRMMLVVVGAEPAWFHGTSALLSAALLILLLFSSRGLDSLKGADYAVWFSVGHVILWFLVPDRPIWVLSFSKQQLFFLLIATGLTGWGWLKEMKLRGGFHG
ncbi:hypothetical protein EHV15_21125 [Paenibacillus oralis]|uniref:Prolipoprotein diacylglyceryl transferase n=1 Tax=Paenibacillus oralis TaxID=2490856 RepID=A0A3P3U446_9BACL|nr:hypothetical protein [Paenibacillus oralis]RRJ65137.1 hypothetical protein EHV15_21125 [Paenibacillus oralis]